MSVQTKSAQMKSARGASASREFARAKSTPSTCSKPAMRNSAQSAEMEGDVDAAADAFDRAINEASKAGLLDEMIAKAVQDKLDGKTTPF